MRSRRGARVLQTEAVGLLRFESAGTATLVAQSRTPWDPPPLGTRLTLEGENVVTEVVRTGRAARDDDWANATGAVAAMASVLGIRSVVATPIVVEGRPWGTLIVATSQSEPLPGYTEGRAEQFAGLVATAIANTEARAELSRLADEQAALRRVATLVADGASPRALFDAVALEMERLLVADAVSLARYEPDERDHDAGRSRLGVVAFGRARHRRSADRRPGPALGVAMAKLEGRALAAGRHREAHEAIRATARDRHRQRRQSRPAHQLTGAPRHGRRCGATSCGAGSPRRRAAAARAHHRHPQARPAGGWREPRKRWSRSWPRALEYAERGNAELRELAHGLLPAPLTTGGVGAGVDALLDGSTYRSTSRFRTNDSSRKIEASAYFIVAEALTNVVKHARATAAEVMAYVEDDILHVEVHDDGVGGADRDGHGLLGLADRATALGGRLEVESRSSPARVWQPCCRSAVTGSPARTHAGTAPRRRTRRCSSPSARCPACGRSRSRASPQPLPTR